MCKVECIPLVFFFNSFLGGIVFKIKKGIYCKEPVKSCLAKVRFNLFLSFLKKKKQILVFLQNHQVTEDREVCKKKKYIYI